ncbi:MAG TPA: SPOR domain-containing protein [Feifaniaceae bacterium]|nr:SPOR domain-containing protein [Feifaniaceae bacterium]
MEFRRKKRKRRRAASEGGGSAGKAILALIVIAAVVYLVSASAAGTWIAQNVVAPVFTWVDNQIKGAPAEATPDGIVQVPEATAGGSVASGNTVTAEVELPAMECFALQMGVFSTQTNAETEAEALQKRGAGGYVMEDAGKYRVLAAAYTERGSLDQVREQLKTEGLDSALYTFLAPMSTLRVTATEAQLTRIRNGFAALNTLQKEIADASLTFDKEQQKPEEGKSKAAALLTELKAAKDVFLAEGAGSNPVLSAMETCFNKYEDALTELSGYDTESFVDFSSKMKYTHLYIAHAYATLAQQVSAMA